MVNSTCSKALFKLESKPLNSAAGDLGRVIYRPLHAGRFHPGGRPRKPGQVSTALPWSPAPELHKLAGGPARRRSASRWAWSGDRAARRTQRGRGRACAGRLRWRPPEPRSGRVRWGSRLRPGLERVRLWERWWGELRCGVSWHQVLKSYLGPEAQLLTLPRTDRAST